jgi:antitoxin component of RelBE/YafQ-DinJ toxin-antitoxin module
LDPKVQEKIDQAMRAAAEEAKQLGLNMEDAMQLIADRLINDPDPDVVAFQEGHNNYVERLRQIDVAQRAERDDGTPIN